MKVKDLIKELGKWNQEHEVVICHDQEEIEFYDGGVYEDCGRLLIDTGEVPQKVRGLK